MKRLKRYWALLCLAMVMLLPGGLTAAYAASTTPLYFYPADADCTVKIEKRNGPTEVSLQYSTNNSSWKDYTVGNSINVKKGTYLYFRAKNASVQCMGRVNGDYMAYHHFVISGSAADVRCYGNVMSLLSSNFSAITTVPEYGLNNLFSGCSKITTAPQVPATTVGKQAYQGMFSGCASLQSIPTLPSTGTFGESACIYMFNGCSALTSVEVPVINATSRCFEYMFQDCTGLVEAQLACTSVAYRSFANMFKGCTNLCRVSVSFETWPTSSSSTSGWLDGVALKGTIDGPEALTCSTIGTSSVPTGWTLNPDYLCFTSESGTSYVELSTFGSPAELQLLYSKDRYNWIYLNVGASKSISLGTKLYVRAATKNDSFSLNANHYHYFKLTGKVAASGNAMSVLDATCQQTSLPSNGLSSMFFNQAALTKAPKLPATTLGEYAYWYMFSGCTSLEEAPELPATTLTRGCYYEMFYGCTSLTKAPDLPATTLVSSCYSQMFYGCKKINHISVGFSSWLSGATTNWLYDVASEGAFDCPDALTVTSGSSYIPSGWVKNPDYLCFTAVQAGSSVTMVMKGSPSAVSLLYSTNRYNWNNYSIGTSLNLPSVGSKIYFRAGSNNNASFSRSSSNYYTVQLTGKVAASGNVMSLLDGKCKQTSVPDYAFYRLFDDTSNKTGALTSAPKLPATMLASYCYSYMFEYCTGLKTAPALPASVMKDYCYFHMFGNCTSLENAPVLNSTSLAPSCYYSMFYACANLKNAPALPATTLANSCYAWMLSKTGLTTAPVLPATTLAAGCYHDMFNGCSNLSHVSVNFSSWLSGATTDWLNGVASEGTFDCPDALAATTGVSYIPSGWVKNPDYLCFTAEQAGSSVSVQKKESPVALSLMYSTDRRNWKDLVVGTTSVNLPSVGSKVYVRAKSKNTSWSSNGGAYHYFQLTGKVAASGNVMSVLDATCKQTTVGNNGLSSMFRGQAALTKAPKLPATSLDNYAYYYMFRECTSLQEAPELPLASMSQGCYYGMFYGCTSMTKAPALPATTLVSKCYCQMFYGCSKLTFLDVRFENWSSSYASDWLSGISTSGVLVCPESLSKDASLQKPSNWKCNVYKGEVKTNAHGYATYSSPVPQRIVGEGKAYYCSLTADNDILCTNVADGYIPAGTGVILLSEEANGTVQLERIDDEVPVSEMNRLRATTNYQNPVLPMPESGYSYALNGCNFVHYVGSSFAANKAYLWLPQAVNAPEMRLIFDDVEEETETSGIEVLADETTEDSDQKAFRLDGTRIDPSQKGLRVMNGKTILYK